MLDNQSNDSPQLVAGTNSPSSPISGKGGDVKADLLNPHILQPTAGDGINLATITLDENKKIKIRGCLNFLSAENIFQKGLQIIQAQPNCIIDLAEIQKSDSAGLATLVAWRNHCLKHKMTITFINLPQQILAMARLCGLEGIISEQR